MSKDELFEIIDAVETINNRIYETINPDWYDRHSQDDYNYPELNIQSNGCAAIITFMAVTIWSSEDDEREFIEEKNDYEPFEPFLEKEIKKLLEKASKLVIK